MCIVIKKFEDVVVLGVDNVDVLYKEVVKVIDMVELKGLIYKNKVNCDKFCLSKKIVK